MSEHPPLDPAKLLAQWMEWERGDTNPGELVKNLKRAGLRELLEEMAGPPAERQDTAGSATDTATA